MTKIAVDMVDAVKVQFLQPIFEDDFPERGMVAYLVKVEKHHDGLCKLYFDFTEFEAQNDKYLAQVYYPNCHTRDIELKTGRTLFTAKEAGFYSNKYDVYFDFSSNAQFEADIMNYLRVIE